MYAHDNLTRAKAEHRRILFRMLVGMVQHLRMQYAKTEVVQVQLKETFVYSSQTFCNIPLIIFFEAINTSIVVFFDLFKVFLDFVFFFMS